MTGDARRLLGKLRALQRYNCDCLPNDDRTGQMATDEAAMTEHAVNCERWVVLADELEAALSSEAEAPRQQPYLNKALGELRERLFGPLGILANLTEDFPVKPESDDPIDILIFDVGCAVWALLWRSEIEDQERQGDLLARVDRLRRTLELSSSEQEEAERGRAEKAEARITELEAELKEQRDGELYRQTQFVNSITKAERNS